MYGSRSGLHVNIYHIFANYDVTSLSNSSLSDIQTANGIPICSLHLCNWLIYTQRCQIYLGGLSVARWANFSYLTSKIKLQKGQSGTATYVCGPCIRKCLCFIAPKKIPDKNSKCIIGSLCANPMIYGADFNRVCRYVQYILCPKMKWFWNVFLSYCVQSWQTDRWMDSIIL